MKIDFERLNKEMELHFEIAKRITKTKAAPIYLRGGKIRDFILGRNITISDYDFLGNFDLNQIQNDFPQLVIGRWDEVSTIKLKIGSQIYDFTASTNVEHTINNSDITLSCMCLDNYGNFYDYLGSLQDLEDRIIKINEPDKKLSLDPSRILRVFRFAGELKFDIEQSTLDSSINKAYLLKDAEYISEMWKILALDYDSRLNILRDLHICGIDKYLIYPSDDRENLQELLSIEKQIDKKAPIDNIRALLGNPVIYLVGGFIRDIILDKPAKDFDFKTKLSLENMIGILERKGYHKTEKLDLENFEYYVNERAKAISIYYGNVDIDISEMQESDINAMIGKGDVNFNCCVYNLQSHKLENPSIIDEIKRRELKFCNSDRARESPLVVISALKQISRLPEIAIPAETREVIASSIPAIIRLIKERPGLDYKIDTICNNLNSEQTYAFFESIDGGKEFLRDYALKYKKLKTTNSKYTSMLITDISDNDKLQIKHLLRESYGCLFDESKASLKGISSIVFERRRGIIGTCCLIDGERVYAAAANSGDEWIEIFEDIRKSNYNIWFTIDADNPKI
ncbi:MAG: hypothetical protein PHO02_04705 [Candidatus Nanoarchaeia archaeon]|nr:hypothetical protein [Candidatus Nanoarchaeia archaeon]